MGCRRPWAAVTGWVASRRSAGKGRIRWIIGVVVTVVLGVPLAAVLDPVAATALDRPGPQVDAAAPARAAGAGPGPVASGVRPFTLPAPVWPAAGVAEKGAGSSPLRVETLDRAATRKAGVDGVLLRVRQADAAATAGGKGRLDVDYSTFRYAYGGDWSTRLGLYVVPECALTTPLADRCRRIPLAFRNDVAAGVVTAEVAPDAAAGTLIALAAGAAGSDGDFAATPLSASSAWAAGAGSGGFTWAYPMRVPPSLGGPEPGLALGYSSASVDGRMAASNNQPSWIGEGFDFSQGFIERRYKPCAKDGGNGASAGTSSGDLCWKTDNAVLSLGDRSAELIKGSDGTWHARSEDGLRIERHKGAGNGDDDGEYWVATDTDGVQYWFGKSRLPGWSAGRAETGSVWTVPVYGNQSGEPCSESPGWCQQAWRWNLDHVVDPFGNTMSLWYVREGNKYARNQAVVGAEDRFVQPAQEWAGFDGEMLGEAGPRASECLQRLGLPAVAVQRDHQERVQPLAVRIGAHELGQLGGRGGVLAAGEADFDATLDSVQAPFLQPVGGRFEVRRREPVERRPPPQGQRGRQRGVGAVEIAVRDQLFGLRGPDIEPRQVQLVVLHARDIARSHAVDERGTTA